MNVTESGGSSNSSSSESDSDLEDVDEEVARLNASLIEQTAEQQKTVNARPESSSSFNLCKKSFQFAVHTSLSLLTLMYRSFTALRRSLRFGLTLRYWGPVVSKAFGWISQQYQTKL